MRIDINLTGVRLIIVAMAIIPLIIMIILTRIDNIIHVILYNFGLTFSYRWAMPYWVNSGFIIGFSWFNIAASFALIYYLFRSKIRPQQQQKMSNYTTPVPLGIEEPLDELSTELIETQISDLSFQIVEYDVRHPKEVVDSQC
ncbi:MAG: hypothetical protein JSV05_10085 [Candidatus Bathyarchaeota archaeon]|nr:MAG: hypothetical protein JSV05_10085 [Candidatus Bathyarchaeota archaeon]